MPGQVRFQAFFNAAFIGLALAFVASCGSSRSAESNGASAGATPPPGLSVGHMRPELANGFDTDIEPVDEAAYGLQEDAAGNAPLFEDEGREQATSVTQGTLGEDGRTDDRVSLTIVESAPTGVTIDAGNDGAGNLTFTEDAPPLDMTTGDRRRTMLGTANDDEDPLWAYRTRTFTQGDADAPEADDFAVSLVDWSGTAGNYVGGGIWERRGAGGALVAVGAFVDGERATREAEILAATGEATYRGHSYGIYTTLPAAAGERNFGLFAAKATLTVDFSTSTSRGGLSGTISDFLFSQNNSFDMDNVSALEGVFGSGLRILLGNASITREGGFEGLVRSGPLTAGEGDSETNFFLTGIWGGRFFGDPGRTGYLSPVVGGTWGAAGESGNPALNGFALSLIGSFGTRFDYGGGLDLGGLPFDRGGAPGTPVADQSRNQVKYVAAAGNAPLFADGEAFVDAETMMPTGIVRTASSVTQGSATTPDRVYLTISGAGAPTGVSIDVGNDVGNTDPMPTPIADLTANGGLDTPATGDRRRGTGLGAGTAADPSWAYDTRTYTAGDPNTPAEGDIEVTLVDWSAGDDEGGYLGGGVWLRTITGGVEVGAFVDGGTPASAEDVLARTGTATYRGHSYGRYSFNNIISGEAGPGYFAAKAVLNVDFGDAMEGGMVSGTISDFLFSQDNTFTSPSLLEGAIGGANSLTIALGTAPIMANSFTGETAGNNTIRVGSESIDLAGSWGGRFYGTLGRPGYLPPLVGGTWGAAGATGSDLVSFSLIGAFGARFDYGEMLDVSGIPFGAPDTNHGIYRAASRNALLFVNESNVQVSSVTQGSSFGDHDEDEDTPVRTLDRVYLTIDGTTRLPTGVTIDVGGSATDLTGATPGTVLASPANTDRRRTELGAGGDDDPVWAYGTRSYETANTPVAAGDYAVTLVDWSAGTDEGGYLGGGVWSRVVTGGSVEVGAFVDGEDPVMAAAVNAATSTATYRGHSYGRYSFDRNIMNEMGPGYFAAKAELVVDFGDAMEGGMVSGTISDFLFSADNTFTADDSALEAAIGGADGLSITLRGVGAAEPTAAIGADGTFAGETAGNSIRVGSARLDLRGSWGGRFYGSQGRDGYLPPLVGGTWGAADSDAGGVSFSLIGAFGARFDYGGRFDLGGVIFTDVAQANHAAYDRAARRALLFVNESGVQASSITQGSATTPDRVYLTIDGSSMPTNVSIDVGNNGTGVGMEDLTFAVGAVDTPADDDRRRGAGLGTMDDATDPLWTYATRTIEVAATPAEADDFTVHLVDFSSGTDDGGYLGGGVWSRVAGVTAGVAEIEVGAFVDGDDPVASGDMSAATGSATYRGHSYGRYSFNNNITSEMGPGYFAAKATLNVDFGDATALGTISGTVSDFLFSADNMFTATDSTLEAAIGGAGGLVINLEGGGTAGTVTITSDGTFSGTTAGNNTIRVGTETITLAGNWGGRFYGTPSGLFSQNRPNLVGGTWGAEGAVMETGGVSFSLIGAFGARYDAFVDLTDFPFASSNDNHARYTDAAGNWALFTPGAGDANNSSVTQGSVREDPDTDPATTNRTDDAVYLTIVGSEPTNVLIDVGNDGTGGETDLESNGTLALSTPDRRWGVGVRTEFWTTGDATDPAWNYTTRRFTRDALGDGGILDENDFEVLLVDWSGTGGGGYLGGGVWSRVYDSDDDPAVTTLDTEVGAFVDGENPLTAVDVRTVGSATYRGHSYGRYSFNNIISGEVEGPGFFAAKALLEVDFGTNAASGTVSGSLTNFLFSRNLAPLTIYPFTEGAKSELEDAIGGENGLVIALGGIGVATTPTATATITTDGTFEGETASNSIRVGSESIDLAGRWGGRFYGSQGTFLEPHLVGGTWGAAGGPTGGVSFSLIGSFGARVDDPPLGPIDLAVVFSTAEHFSQDKYLLAAGAGLLFADGAGGASSVTQGSAATNDRVFLTLDDGTASFRDVSGVMRPVRIAENTTGVMISVGNTGTPLVSSTANEGNVTFDDATLFGGGDRRTTTTLLGAGTGDDPAWDYTVNDFTLVASGDRNDAVGEFEAIFVDWSSARGNYLGGGVWARVDSLMGVNAVLEVGAFVDGEDPVASRAVNAATDTATYRGHAHGRYSFNHGIADELYDDDGGPSNTGTRAGPGFFAAKTTLTAEFGNDTDPGSISGRITDFLFSYNFEDAENHAFTDGTKSDLEDIIGVGSADGLVITLGETTISDRANTFEGTNTVTSNTLRPALGGTLDLMGNWGGRFYGTPDSGEAPSLVGGTFGAEDTDTGSGVSLSLIGSFGAGHLRTISLPATLFGTTPPANHARYLVAARSPALLGSALSLIMAPGADSSVTQGSSKDGGSGVAGFVFHVPRTNDAVYFNGFTDNLPTGVTINIGNDGTTLTESDNGGLVSIPQIAPLDRRRGRALGRPGDAANPAWNYNTRTFDKTTSPQTDGDIEVTLVDWANESDGSYLGGGVWSRVIAGDGLEVGAFVDGSNPTDADDVGDATGEATYRGHAYGRFSFNNNIDGETGPGYFAAKATLTANFLTTITTTSAGSISGEITNFLFSTNSGFTTESALEAEIGGADGFSVALEGALIPVALVGTELIPDNSFDGPTTATSLEINGTRLYPTGSWGGRFYGEPAEAGDAPPVVGGTFGVAAEETNGPSFSIIGSFGAVKETP